MTKYNFFFIFFVAKLNVIFALGKVRKLNYIRNIHISFLTFNENKDEYLH